jgi:hypothetical protein
VSRNVPDEFSEAPLAGRLVLGKIAVGHSASSEYGPKSVFVCPVPFEFSPQGPVEENAQLNEASVLAGVLSENCVQLLGK